MEIPDGISCAIFTITALVPVGCLHTLWLKSAWAKPFAIPIDLGRTFRGRRIFGANKMFRGFMIMTPASGASFFLLSRFVPGPWPLTGWQYVSLGSLAGLGFMLGELPNSFVKRQLDILPGAAPQGFAKWAFLFADRADSIIGMLLAMQLRVPVPGLTWIILLAAGAVIHALFSFAMFQLGIKARAL
jgi:CDP-2,3-bis-(O-geranylgeranyl)-sn-glycerol synthase